MFDPQPIFEEACASIRAGEMERGLALLDQLAAELADDDPGMFMVHTVRAEVLLARDDAREALKLAREAVDLAPEEPYVHFVLGRIHWDLERLGPAQQSFERAVQLSDHDPRFLQEHAWFMASERGPKLAEDVAQKATLSDPDSSLAWAALGFAQLRGSKPREAKESLQRALEIDPQCTQAQFAMVLCLERLGEESQAAALTNVLADSPEAEEVAAEIQSVHSRRDAERRLAERLDETGYYEQEIGRWNDLARWDNPILYAVLVVAMIIARALLF